MKKALAMLKRGLCGARRYALALAVALVGVSAFAETGTGSSDDNMKAITDAVGTWLGNIVGTFKTFFTTNFTTIVAVLSIAVGVTVLWAVFRLFRKGAKSAA